MHVAVCVKQVPGPDAPVGLDPATLRLLREGEATLDEPDSHGVEVALRLAEATGGEVTVISMAPGGASAALRSALAMGAARAMVVSDEQLAGADALQSARVLAALVERSGAEILVAATESSDGYTGTVPVQIAELLGWPALTYATEAECEGGEITVRRQTERGAERVRCGLPAVISVTAGGVEPRYPTLRGIMGARSKPVEELDLAAIGLEGAAIAAASARVQLGELRSAPMPGGGTILVDEGEGHLAILEALERWRVR